MACYIVRSFSICGQLKSFLKYLVHPVDKGMLKNAQPNQEEIQKKKKLCLVACMLSLLISQLLVKYSP